MESVHKIPIKQLFLFVGCKVPLMTTMVLNGPLFFNLTNEGEKRHIHVSQVCMLRKNYIPHLC